MGTPDSDVNPWRAAGVVSAIGADLVVCIVLGYFGGRYASDLAGGHKGWLIAGVMTGLLAGILSVALIIKKFMVDANE